MVLSLLLVVFLLSCLACENSTRMNTRMEVFIVEEKKQALRRVPVLMLVDIFIRVIVCAFGGS